MQPNVCIHHRLQFATTALLYVQEDLCNAHGKIIYWVQVQAAAIVVKVHDEAVTYK